MNIYDYLKININKNKLKVDIDNTKVSYGFFVSKNYMHKYDNTKNFPYILKNKT